MIFSILRRVFRYIPSQKCGSERILYTSWWDKNADKIILHIINSQKLFTN